MHLSSSSIQGFFRQNEKDFRIVYEKTFRLLKHVSFAILHDDEAANDIVHDTYVKVLSQKATKEFSNEKKFVSYLARVAKTLSLDALAKRKNVSSLEYDIPVEEKYDGDYLRIAKETLSQEEFDVVMFRLYHGLRFSTIASLYDRSASSIRGEYFRAIKKLRESGKF